MSNGRDAADQRRHEVPAELAAVVAKMMAKDPAQRYQKPVEVAQRWPRSSRLVQGRRRPELPRGGGLEVRPVKGVCANGEGAGSSG